MMLRRRVPIDQVPQLLYGSKPVDNGALIFNPEEREVFVSAHPETATWFRRYIGTDELLYDKERWCLWLVDVQPAEIRRYPVLIDRIRQVQLFRQKSKKPATQKAALTPQLFGEIRTCEGDYLALPEVSSENRHYFPVALLPADTIASNKIYMLSNSNTFHFGILSSKMHRAWTDVVAGRLESRIQYSSGIVYNNFPWPQQPKPAQVKAVEEAAQAVLAARDIYLRPTPALPSGEGALTPGPAPKERGVKGASLADLYDPLTMPKPLRDAHQKLDRAVDKCYRSQPFANDAKRVEFLFELYEQLILKA